ncbi:DUF6230 family protein [Streptomyces sp. NPDC006514]|uniref:DUF6230 family protein n=1 Tax=Streptomyces sp. NPDC006514 TaxID=3154308 RepID=UPI0033BECCE2
MQTDRSVDGEARPVALLGIGEAALADICRSVEVGAPLGTAVFKLTAVHRGAAGEVTGSNLVIDGDLDAGPGGRGP